MHLFTLLFQINSPILFSGDEIDVSYVSLQPPPYKTVNDTLQFESIDIYYWTGPEFRTPTILFYSGPICFLDNYEHNSDVCSTNLKLNIVIVLMYTHFGS